MACSTTAGRTLRPPVRMTSSMRPVIESRPLSMVPRSSVTNERTPSMVGNADSVRADYQAGRDAFDVADEIALEYGE